MSTISATTDLNPDFLIIGGDEDIRQRVIQRLRFFRGEWALDTAAGVPWFQRILTRPVEIGITSAIISEAIASVIGVNSVQQVEANINRETRTLQFEATVITDNGELVINEEIGA